LWFCQGQNTIFCGFLTSYFFDKVATNVAFQVKNCGFKPFKKAFKMHKNKKIFFCDKITDKPQKVCYNINVKRKRRT
jgi:hypothetical protein